MKIGFLFKNGKAARIELGGPTDFLYGQPQLADMGVETSIIEDIEYGLNRPPRLLARVMDRFFVPLVGIPASLPIRIVMSGMIKRLNEYDLIVVPMRSYGLSLALLGKLGVFRGRLLFVAMGLIEKSDLLLVRACIRWNLSGVRVVTLAESDALQLSKAMKRTIPAIPFGVDTRYWTMGASNEACTERYVLSIGNDLKRDYQTLLRSWTPEMPKLKIVTSHQIDTDAPNIEIIHGDWHQQKLTDEGVRRLFRNALFVVLPISDCFQPSGQSACLQAMACGKAVVITDFPGLWNREFMQDGITCLYGGEPGNHVSLRKAISDLLERPELAKTIGLRARQVVESHLNVDKMAIAMKQEIEGYFEKQAI